MPSDPAIEQPLSPCIPIPASYPSSPSAIIQQAIAALDFTTLYAEALSVNYTQPSTPSIEAFLPTPEDASGICTTSEHPSNSNSRIAGYRQEAWKHKGRETLVPDEDILALRLMFDPLWDPVVTKTDAIAGYVADLHRQNSG
jgi:hypothetical protein